MPENPADHCRNPGADAALRRIARDSGAAALCDHPHCRRGRRCCGPWLRLLPEKPAALPACLYIKVGRDLVEAREAASRLAELGERIKDVFMEEDAFPDPEEAARRVAALIETDVMERMAKPGSRRRAPG
jgi:hypothetical protein